MKRQERSTRGIGLCLAAIAAVWLAGCSLIGADPAASGRGFIDRSQPGREVYVGAPGSWWEAEVDAVSANDLPAGTKLTRESCPEARVRVVTPLPERLDASY